MVEFYNKKRNLNVQIDVNVYAINTPTKEGVLMFSFSKNALRKILDNKEHITWGIDSEHPERVYFKETNKLSGYKLTQPAKGNRASTSFGNSTTFRNPKSFEGWYSLNYDEDQELYFIDKNKKIEE